MHLAETSDCSSMNGFAPIKDVGLWPDPREIRCPSFARA